jgi:hypothetical protein
MIHMTRWEMIIATEMPFIQNKAEVALLLLAHNINIIIEITKKMPSHTSEVIG